MAGHKVGAENKEGDETNTGYEEDGHEPAEGNHGLAVVGKPEDNSEPEEDIKNDEGGGKPGGQVCEVDEGDGEVHSLSLRRVTVG